jgi:HEAT repeat protein
MGVLSIRARQRNCLIAVGVGLLAALAWTIPVRCQEPVLLLHAWETDPELPAQWIVGPPPPQEYSARLDLLNSKVRQERIEEAQRIAHKAVKVDLANRVETFETLVELLQAGEANRSVGLAYVTAACEIVASSDEAGRLWEAVSEGDSLLRQIVEPCLVQWQSPAALSVWRKRLRDDRTIITQTVIAMEGLGLLGESSDRPALESSLLSERSRWPVRLAAARALGRLLDSELESLAEEVWNSSLDRRGLLAASLLVEHRSEPAIGLLLEIIERGSPPAQIASYRALDAVDHQRAVELAEELLQHPDDTMRLAVIDVLNAEEGAESLNLQATALSDSIPRVRRVVRQNLRDKASQAELGNVVDEIIDHFLTGDRVEGIEQSVLLVSELQQHRRASVLAELLDHPDANVSVRAAWALQTLELEEEMLARVHQRLIRLTEDFASKEAVSDEQRVQGTFLIDALGRHAYRPADAMLRRYIPKGGEILSPHPRAAAIYALGKIWEGSEDVELADRLAERMLDDDPMNPEDDTVKYASAVALGRIGAPASAQPLRQVPEPPPVPRAVAAAWSLQQLAESTD